MRYKGTIKGEKIKVQRLKWQFIFEMGAVKSLIGV